MDFTFTKKAAKALGILCILAGSFVAPFSSLFAEESSLETNLLEPTSWGLDETLYTEDQVTRRVEQIHVVEIPLNEKFLYISDDELARSVFYHFVFRLGYREPLANILITPSGKTYQLSEGELDAQIQHEKSKGIAVVGIISTDTFAIDSQETALSDTLAYLCSIYRLDSKDVFASDWKTSLEEAPIFSLIPSADLELTQLVSSVQAGLSEKIEHVPYNITATAESFSVDAEAQEEVEVEVTFTNNGDWPIYGGESASSLLLGTLDPKDHKSSFYTSTWASMSRGGSVVEERIGKGQTGTIKLVCAAPVLPGEHSETFGIISPDGTVLTETEIAVTINVKDTGQKVLEIEETGTGYLNVRDRPSGYSNIIDQVPVGNVYLYTDYQGGYYKIDNGEKSGWVTGRYVNVLNN